MSNTEHGKFQMRGNTGVSIKNNRDNPTPQQQQAHDNQLPDTAEGHGNDGGGRVDEVYNELIHMRKMNKVLG